jgi:hypothetical protein
LFLLIPLLTRCDLANPANVQWVKEAGQAFNLLTHIFSLINSLKIISRFNLFINDRGAAIVLGTFTVAGALALTENENGVWIVGINNRR